MERVQHDNIGASLYNQCGEEQLFSACHDIQSKMVDQVNRADSIVKNLNCSKTILMMDGHGRMYYYILKSLASHGFDMDEYHFIFVDIDFNVNNNLEIYPNPSEGLFNLNFNNVKAGSYNVEVRNMVGQLVHSGSINLTKDGNTTLDLSNISKGAYLLNISGKNVEINESIVIK